MDSGKRRRKTGYGGSRRGPRHTKPLQDTRLKAVKELAGSGKNVFAGIDPDEYVRQLRRGWT